MVIDLLLTKSNKPLKIQLAEHSREILNLMIPLLLRSLKIRLQNIQNNRNIQLRQIMRKNPQKPLPILFKEKVKVQNAIIQRLDHHAAMLPCLLVLVMIDMKHRKPVLGPKLHQTLVQPISYRQVANTRRREVPQFLQQWLQISLRSDLRTEVNTLLLRDPEIEELLKRLAVTRDQAPLKELLQQLKTSRSVALPLRFTMASDPHNTNPQIAENFLIQVLLAERPRNHVPGRLNPDTLIFTHRSRVDPPLEAHLDSA